MKKILIVADGVTTAHPTRMDQLINQIDKKKFEIHFATTPNFFALLSSSSDQRIKTYPITSIPIKTFVERIYNTQFPWNRSELDAQLKEDLALLKEIRPDIVIGDTRLTLGPACKAEGIKYYNLMNVHWLPSFQRPVVVPYIRQVENFGRRPVSLLLNWISPVVLFKQKLLINSWLKSVGSTPVNSVFDFYAQGDHLLFPDLRAHFENVAIPENCHFIGPLVWKNTKSQWPQEWGTLDPKKKYALLSMGSSGETKHIPLVVKALNFLGFVVIYVGPKTVFDKQEKYQMLTADFVPLDEVLEHCSLAISNGGTGTTYHFMSKGVVSYYLPTNMDQYLSVHRLRELGLSDYQDIDQFSEKTFIEKVTKLVNSSQLREQYKATQKIIEDEIANNPINDILSR